MKRLRLVSVQLLPQVVMDDGETLVPVQTRPIVVSANELDTVPSVIRKGIEEAQAQLDG